MPKIPDFKTAEEEAEFWETHSVSDYWDEFKPVKEELDPKLKAKIKFIQFPPVRHDFV